MNSPQEQWFGVIPTRALNPLLSPLPNPPLALSRSVAISSVSEARELRIDGTLGDA